VSGRDRISFPFFFDPNFNAEVKALPLDHIAIDDRDERWDKASVHEFRGTYGDYLLGKVSKVFPQLQRDLS
jgi:isopenicillin N synthase-like dioxygenase